MIEITWEISNEADILKLMAQHRCSTKAELAQKLCNLLDNQIPAGGVYALVKPKCNLADNADKEKFFKK